MDNKSSGTVIEKLSAFIVDKRKAFVLAFAIAVVFCVSLIPKVNINNDLSIYLSNRDPPRL